MCLTMTFIYVYVNKANRSISLHEYQPKPVIKIGRWIVPVIDTGDIFINMFHNSDNKNMLKC